jgi:hypothetical protein
MVGESWNSRRARSIDSQKTALVHCSRSSHRPRRLGTERCPTRPAPTHRQHRHLAAAPRLLTPFTLVLDPIIDGRTPNAAGGAVRVSGLDLLDAGDPGRC